ncbi:zinc-ribbon domain-containing protein [uncultured Sphingomonas sp.]|uniref:zinc-ribbon domain-containing protein n=1 Tax=uncultured Sphingomonas sp. TaxID=158754 RepID=UPI0025D506CC|nr:zinc-ribbon domain-containing protein [uncultured Sphingomonas sp.]
MILECTQCSSRYLVPDTAIGPDGRTVRCANCRHSWFQPPAMMDLSAATRAAAYEPEAPAPQPVAAAPIPAPAAPIEAPRAAESQPLPRPAMTRTFDDTLVEPRPQYDAFAHRPPFKPRTNPARRWTAAALVAGCSMLLGVGAILYSGAPGIAAQLGLPVGTAETPLKFTGEAIERRDMGTGSELFAVSGTIVNPTGAAQRVPDVRVALLDAQGRVVYNWTVTPKQRTLGPNASVGFASGRTDVPANSKMLSLSFAQGIEG